MSMLHEALETLGPADFADVPLDDLNSFLSSAFSNGQLIVDSVPTPASSSSSGHRKHGRGSSHGASSESNTSTSSATSVPANPNILSLQKEWKPVKLNSKDNPLGISVYKLGSKDGKGAWFARTSVHEGLGFEEWKAALEREFPETMKAQGGPGEGNIRGIGGERRIESQHVEGVGKMEVYLLSAQFPGPTTARDFVTMFLTSDQLSANLSGDGDPLRHFMVVSRPCLHSDTAPRDGYVRGQYESVEYIRELPGKKPRLPSASTTELNGMIKSSQSLTLDGASPQNSPNRHTDGSYDSRAASESNLLLDENSSSRKDTRHEGLQDSNAKSKEPESLDDEYEQDSHPIEWIMITRSDPGGSVPRFMVERGTPGGIVSDASKFLDWARSCDLKDFESDDEASGRKEGELNTQTEGYIPPPDDGKYPDHSPNIGDPEREANDTQHRVTSTGQGLDTGAPGTIPAVATESTNRSVLPKTTDANSAPSPAPRDGRRNIVNGSSLHRSNSFVSSISSNSSFASAAEVLDDERDNEATSLGTMGVTGIGIQDAKTLQKLEMKKKKLDEKLSKVLDKETKSKGDDNSKREEAIRKAEEKHRKEVEKLERKKEKEIRKAEEKKRKMNEKDEKGRILKELDDAKAEVNLLRKEKENLEVQVSELQEANKALAGKIVN